MAIQVVHFSSIKALAMSIFIFAGAAQLIFLSLFAIKTSFLMICLSIFFITSQHFIYALTLRENFKGISLKKRLIIGFLLTDEMFALSVLRKRKDFNYLFGVGLCFYLFWVIFSLIGILLARNLQNFHLDFSIIALFIPIIIGQLKKWQHVIPILCTLITTLILKFLHISASLVIAGLIGMFVGAVLDREND